MNSCSFVGRLVRDPKLIRIDRTYVVEFCLAINEYRRLKDGNKTKQVDYFDFEAWDSGATAIAKHCKKGDELAVLATARQFCWSDDSGKKTSGVKFRVSNFNLFPRNEKDLNEKQATG